MAPPRFRSKWSGPDGGYHRGHPDPETVYLPTEAVVVEVLSPGDETYDELGSYAAHRVDEVLVVEGDERRVHILVLEEGTYLEAPRSVLACADAAGLEAAIRWP